jgi:chromosome partitioning protein
MAVGASTSIETFNRLSQEGNYEAQLKKLTDLSWQEFQGFIEHVFNYAGYKVKDVSTQKWPQGPGFDLELLDPETNKLVSYVEVRRLSLNNILDFNHVSSFIGRLTLARKHISSFMITTSDFTGPAYEAAKQHGNAFLINGQRLLRYIHYITNSRLENQNIQSDTPIFVPPTILWDADALQFRDPRQTTVVTIGNNKGGVAKTTTTINLGFALAHEGYRVLLVDFDSQASLTVTLPPPDKREYPTLLDFFMRKATLPDIVRPTQFSNVWILPAHPDLKHLDTGASARPNDELHWARCLHTPDLITPEGAPFDWILLDTPPAQTRYTRAALASSHYTLIPTVADTYGILGIKQYISTRNALRALMGKHVNVLGTFITKWKELGQTRDHLDELYKRVPPLGAKIYKTKIPYDNKIEKAHVDTSSGRARSLFGLTSTAARGYIDLMKEILSDGNYITAHH